MFGKRKSLQEKMRGHLQSKEGNFITRQPILRCPTFEDSIPAICSGSGRYEFRRKPLGNNHRRCDWRCGSLGLRSYCELGQTVSKSCRTKPGKDTNGHPVYKAERTKVAIQDVMAAEGQRLPDVDHSQRKFNTGIVVVVEHGQSPSHELLERANGIRRQWIEYWETTTGHRASMTANPR